VTATITTQARCAACVHFRDDAAFLEQSFRGLNALSSVHGSTRGDDGVCQRHDRYVSARGGCRDFQESRAADDRASRPD